MGWTNTKPSNGMAPTILGRHFDGTCEVCGEAQFVSGSRSGARFADQPVSAICDNFHAAEVPCPVLKPIEGDRIFCASFLKPQRWDLAVFQAPRDPQVNYVMRVVGLPGETIYVADGSVFANGTRLKPPGEISQIVFSQRSGGLEAINGTREHPAVLGPDEYFVLGDNTDTALDSRHWQSGAADHNRFAVPESYFVGVVTTIYWPLRRWKSFR
jgi:signal peptidase I